MKCENVLHVKSPFIFRLVQDVAKLVGVQTLSFVNKIKIKSDTVPSEPSAKSVPR